MKPFRTNAKDRKKFAKVLGLRDFVYQDPRASTDADIRTNEDVKILAKQNTVWYFYRAGFQWTVAKLAEDHIYYYPVGPYTELTSNHLPNARGYGKSLGEQLFRAVVKLHDKLEKSK